MAYFQLSVEVDADGAPRLEACLQALGAASVTFADAGDEPILEPAPGEAPLWGRLRATALFDADAHDPNHVHQILRESTGWDPLPGYRLQWLPERAWERAWLDDFRPMRFGERLWICPTTAEAPDDPRAVVVWLDPGLAFGTGTHPTTALCLEWLEGIPLAGRTVLDYGCGSGVLAIAAAKLGARHCVAVDNDPQALRATRDNAERNGVAGAVTIRHADQGNPVGAELLVANILSGTLRDLAPRLMSLLPAGAPFALSGILLEQADSVAAAYRPHAGLDVPRRRGEWMLLSGRRR